MSDLEERELEQTPEVELAARPSILEQLRAQRDATVEGSTTLLQVPGWKGLLCVRYRHVSYASLVPVFSPVRQAKVPSGRLEVGLASDLLIRACQEVFGRERDGTLVRLSDDPEPVRFDERLMAALGRTPSAPSARAAVFEAFQHNDQAIVDQADDLNRWLRGLEESADEDGLGE